MQLCLHLNANFPFKILPVPQQGPDEFEITDVKRIRAGLSCSRNTEGALINLRQAGRWGGQLSWQPMATSGGDAGLRFKCTSHFHGAERAQIGSSLGVKHRWGEETGPVLLPHPASYTPGRGQVPGHF